MKPQARTGERPDGVPSDLSTLAVAIAIVAIGGLILTAIWGFEPSLPESSPQAPSAPYYHAHGKEYR